MKVKNLLNIRVRDVSIFLLSQIQALAKVGYDLLFKRYRIIEVDHSKAYIIFRLIFPNSLISVLTKCSNHNASTNHNQPTEGVSHG